MKYKCSGITAERCSRSREGAWIEILLPELEQVLPCVAPARERGLKLYLYQAGTNFVRVAPARERGLKYPDLLFRLFHLCRSREGAWIEIDESELIEFIMRSLPRGSVD